MPEFLDPKSSKFHHFFLCLLHFFFFNFIPAVVVGQLIVALGISLLGGENSSCGDVAVMVACGVLRGVFGQNQVLVKDRELP